MIEPDDALNAIGRVETVGEPGEQAQFDEPVERLEGDALDPAVVARLERGAGALAVERRQRIERQDALEQDPERQE